MTALNEPLGRLTTLRHPRGKSLGGYGNTTALTESHTTLDPAQIGERLKDIRCKAFDEATRPELAEIMSGTGLDITAARIRNLEAGNGTGSLIYTVLGFLYDQGINLHYLFGEAEIRRVRVGERAYSANVTDYLDEVERGTVDAIGQLRSLLDTATRLNAHLRGAEGEAAAASVALPVAVLEGEDLDFETPNGGY